MATPLNTPHKIFAGKTDIGLKRENNEDAFRLNPELDFCLAADGMGGAAAGEVASKIFAEAALEIFSDKTNPSEREILYRVYKAYSHANQKILAHVTTIRTTAGWGAPLSFWHSLMRVSFSGTSETAAPIV